MSARTVSQIVADASDNEDAMLEAIHETLLTYHKQQEMLALELRQNGYPDKASDLMSESIGNTLPFGDKPIFQDLLKLVAPRVEDMKRVSALVAKRRANPNRHTIESEAA